MGKKHKKQRRQERVKATRDTQAKQLQGPKKARRDGPIWKQPVIEFVRGEDYEPVKYGIKDSRDIKEEDFEYVLPEIDSEGELVSAGGGPQEDEVEPEIEEEDPEVLPQIEDSNLRSDLDSDSEVEPEVEPEVYPEIDPEIDPEDLDSNPEHPDSNPESDPSFDLYDDLDSDAEPFDEPILDMGHQIDPRFEDTYSDSDPEMDMDIDYNDMEIDQLTSFGHGIDDDYSYDMGADSDADDIISALLGGASLDQFERKSKGYNKQPKQPLSKRRRERLEARDAARARNFGKAPALWQKYPTTINVHEVVEELQVLVTTPNLQEILFPPLDNNANWYVEQLAKMHNLKTKGLTKNHANCVRAIKTSRSGPPDFNKLQRLLRRRQNFPRVDVERPAREASQAAKPKTSRPREGDIVGHNAQALSHGFGHQMLLEMGWSAGRGLGVLKDGIPVPLPARVKLTKWGLGSSAS